MGKCTLKLDVDHLGHSFLGGDGFPGDYYVIKNKWMRHIKKAGCV